MQCVCRCFLVDVSEFWCFALCLVHLENTFFCTYFVVQAVTVCLISLSDVFECT